ncbi:MAG: hypothetical protein ABIO71_12625 [Caldimonas sp.]
MTFPSLVTVAELRLTGTYVRAKPMRSLSQQSLPVSVGKVGRAE